MASSAGFLPAEANLQAGSLHLPAEVGRGRRTVEDDRDSVDLPSKPFGQQAAQCLASDDARRPVGGHRIQQVVAVDQVTHPA